MVFQHKSSTVRIHFFKYFNINYVFIRSAEPLFFNFIQLMNAIRSQLYFSQLTAWLTVQDDNNLQKITNKNIMYRLTLPGETFESTKFSLSAVKHEFPLTDIGNGFTVTVSFLSLPRMSSLPPLVCSKCAPKKVKPTIDKKEIQNGILDDRMHTSCTLKGKHRCEDFEDVENVKNQKGATYKRLCQNGKKELTSAASTSRPKLTVDIHKANNFHNNRLNSHKNDLIVDKGKLLLDAIERSGLKSTKERSCDEICVQQKDESDNGYCDMSESDISISSIKGKSKYDLYVDNCDKNDIDHVMARKIRKKLFLDDEKTEIPSALEQAKFRKELDNAASMVFHSRTGLPLTSSPAPVRRGKTCFDFDSSINSVSAIKR